MKVTRLFLATLAAALLPACTNDENSVIDNGTSQATFTAAIGGQVSTRAYDTSWEAGDAIGISGTTGGTAYTNVQYKTGRGDGNFTVGTIGEEIYYQDNNAVTFTAYYPWNDLQGATIDADTREQALQKDFDFLWAQASGSKASPAVSFSFAHKMAKLVLTVRRGDDVSYDEVESAVLSLAGFKNNGTFSVTDGAATATGEDLTEDWTFAGNTADESHNAPSSVNETEGTVTYTLILFPQELTAALPFTATLTGMQSFGATLDFTAANADAGDTEPRNGWTAGREYALSVTLHKTGISVSGCTIQDWDTTNGGNVDAV